jgi:hypothetical protein
MSCFGLLLPSKITSLYLANAGVPLFSQSIFYQIVLLVPIIVIEAYVHKKLLKVTIIKASYISLSTNLISTIIGGLLIIFLSGTFFGVPVQPGDFPFLPLEIMITLLPLFLFSVIQEVFIGRLGLKGIIKKQINKSFLIANTFTYLMLEVLAISQLVKGYIEGRG